MIIDQGKQLNWNDLLLQPTEREDGSYYPTGTIHELDEIIPDPEEAYPREPAFFRNLTIRPFTIDPPVFPPQNDPLIQLRLITDKYTCSGEPSPIVWLVDPYDPENISLEPYLRELGGLVTALSASSTPFFLTDKLLLQRPQRILLALPAIIGNAIKTSLRQWSPSLDIAQLTIPTEEVPTVAGRTISRYYGEEEAQDTANNSAIMLFSIDVGKPNRK